MHFSRHFTLLELLLVMALLAILTGAVLPSVIGQRAAGQLDGQVQTTLALTRKARAWATSEGRTVILRVEDDGLRLIRARDPLAEADGEEPEIEVPQDGDPTWEQPYEDRVTLALFELDGEEREPGEPGDTDVSFFPNGSSSAARFTFVADDLNTELEVDPVLGLARVVEDVEESQ